ncbi:MAG TPA: universal stress protein [Gemmatales bacterium]|nr:universal stress protein [Gemmatales bacterium]HMP58911.1 universal stress protein [Gemmatales bacterium]
MFKTILVPVDLTDRHGPAVDRAVELAKASGGKVILAHVIETIAGLKEDPEDRHFYDRLERTSRQHLEQIGATVEGRGTTWQMELRFGPVARQVMELAQEFGADLIVVTTPRLNPSNPTTGVASLSWKISLLAPCPVLLVK